MNKVRFRDLLFAAFGERREIPLAEFRRVVFMYYSTAQLLREGSIDKRTSAAKKYTKGDSISEQERSSLLEKGLKRKMSALARCYKSVSLDRSQNVLRRV